MTIFKYIKNKIKYNCFSLIISSLFISSGIISIFLLPSIIGIILLSLNIGIPLTYICLKYMNN